MLVQHRPLLQLLGRANSLPAEHQPVLALHSLGGAPQLEVDDDHDQRRAPEGDDGGVDLVVAVLGHLNCLFQIFEQ